MPIYKGTNEVTSGNLYKGSTEIENGYKASSSFYVNELTWTFSTPSVMSSTSVTSNNLTTFTGAPGSAVTGQDFKILCDSGYAFQGGSGGISISGLPAGMTANVTATGSAGPGTNEVLVTLGGVYPQTPQNIAITATGGTVTAYYTVTINMPSWNWPIGTGTYNYSNQNSVPGGFGSNLNATQYSTPSGSTTSSVWSGSNSVSFGVESAFGAEITSQSFGSATGYSVSTSGSGTNATIILTLSSGTFTGNTTATLSSYGANGSSYSDQPVTFSANCSNYTLQTWGRADLSNISVQVSGTGNYDPRRMWYIGAVTTETTAIWSNGLPYAYSVGQGSSTNYSIQITNPATVQGTSPPNGWTGSNPYTGGYDIGIVTSGYAPTGGLTCT